MRRTLAGLVTIAGLALTAPPVATAEHTGGGCAHQRTGTAHANVPHQNDGTARAHHSIPYCPPQDAPR